jgi:hypothetical protein
MVSTTLDVIPLLLVNYWFGIINFVVAFDYWFILENMCRFPNYYLCEVSFVNLRPKWKCYGRQWAPYMLLLKVLDVTTHKRS